MSLMLGHPKCRQCGSLKLSTRCTLFCSRLSMEGYIFNADAVLQDAVEGKYKFEVPPQVVADCKGVVILNVFEIGAFVTFHYGTGVMMAKWGPKEGSENKYNWSPPVSVMTAGYGMGPIGGGKVDSVLTFLMDDDVMQDFCDVPQTRIGVNAAVSLGRKGGDKGSGFDLKDHKTITYYFTNGAFIGGSLKMGTMNVMTKQNDQFYGNTHVSTKDMLLKPGAVQVPKDTQVDFLYEKMDCLSTGEGWSADEEKLNRSKHFLDLAVEKSEAFTKAAKDKSQEFVAKEQEAPEAAMPVTVAAN